MGEKPRVLVVSSSQFGEFSMALDFAAGLGQDFDHLLLLPAPLAALNQSFYGCCVKTYSSANEIAAHVNAYAPQIIVLFSAYLLVTDRVMGHRRLDRLLHEQTKRGVPLLTSDPFLGIAGTLRMGDLEAPGMVFDDTLARRLPLLFKALFCRVMRSTERVLGDVPKIGSTVAEVPGGCFRGFNNGHGITLHASGNEHSRLPPAPYWLFILSGLDLTLIESRFGVDKAVSLAKRALDCAREQQKFVVAVFPETLARALHYRPHDHVALITNASIEHYHGLLRGAERVFYWNMISHSVSYRLFNDKPAHFLGRGHVQAFIPKLHGLAIEHYYGGAEPPLLDPEKDGLRERELNVCWETQQSSLAEKLRAVGRYPTSGTLMHGLLRRSGHTV